MKTHHAWLCIGPAVAGVLDCGLTLRGQSTIYWEGQYQDAVEGNPVFLGILRLHPLLFAIVSLLCLGLLCLSVLCFPTPAAKIIAWVLLVCHTFGVATWLIRPLPYGVLSCVVLFFIASRLRGWSWKKQADAEQRSASLADRNEVLAT